MTKIFMKILNHLGKKVDLTEVSGSDIFKYIIYKIFPGIIKYPYYKIRLKKCDGIFLVGSNTKVLFKNRLSVGRNCYIADNGYINCLSKKGVVFGDRVTIRENAWLQITSDLSNLGEGIIIDSNVYIGPNAILGAAGLLHIKSGNQIGANVQFIAENHKFNDEKLSISEQGVDRKGIIINENCWIGNNAIILDGVEIGEGCVIGAGSVVTRSIERFSVAVGNPARIIKKIK
ncbi:MAG: DapH/DapD/GlmU-related protein [Sulfuricurvum sp.]|nr:DapH/DapD/GlmU-related protein [Sulfuricurvum sp.]